MHWKPVKKTVELKPAVRPSRIRRDPVPLERKVEQRSREQEMWLGVAGILFMAVLLVAAIVGIAIATIFAHDPGAEAANAKQFGQCYNSDGENCVVSGDTIYADRARTQIAGIAAPDIDGARCAQEKDRGIAAAIGLSGLLQSGNVTVGPSFRDDYGRTVSSVQVKGQDVTEYLIDHGLVRAYTGEKQDWCKS